MGLASKNQSRCQWHGGTHPVEGTGREDDASGGTAMGMGAALGTGTTAIRAREHHVEATARK